MRLLLSLALLIVCLVPAACNKVSRGAVGTLNAPPAVELLLAMKGGQPGGDYGAKLAYEVRTPADILPMRLSNPKQPEGATVELEHARLVIKPFICPPKMDKRRRECSADGCYTLCVRDADGRHVGDFEINDLGALVLKADTHDEENLDIERISTLDRTVFFAYDRAAGGGRGNAVLGLEYVPLQRGGVEVSDADNWSYSFSSPDGRLVVYKPQQLNAMADHMALQAEYQAKSLADSYLEDLEEKQQRFWVGRASGGSAGGACRTGGG